MRTSLRPMSLIPRNRQGVSANTIPALMSELRPQGFSPENPPHLGEGLTKRAIEYAASHIHGNSGR